MIKMLKEVKYSKDGMRYQKAVVQELNAPSTDKKSKIRYQIENEVFDLEDSVADNAKWLSLLTTLLSRFYDTFTDTQKARFSAEDKALIEMMFSKFKTTNTRYDVQFQEEGIALIDKILERQKQIGEIVKK